MAAAQEISSLTMLLFEAVGAFRHRFAEVAAELGLTPLQARAILELEEPMPMRDLAGLLGCDASNITGLADRLEDLSAIERVPGTDRRYKLLSLTPDGQRFRSELHQRVTEGSLLSERLTRAERRELGVLLKKLV